MDLRKRIHMWKFHSVNQSKRMLLFDSFDEDFHGEPFLLPKAYQLGRMSEWVLQKLFYLENEF